VVPKRRLHNSKARLTGTVVPKRRHHNSKARLTGTVAPSQAGESW
jgi:hypothetical protein